MDYRYEHKFVINDLSTHQIEQLIKMHPSIFSEIYYERYINNIYLDSINFKSYTETKNGDLSRIKTRIRWYGKLFGEVVNPTLELKIKRGMLVRKESFSLPSFAINNGFDFSELARVIDRSKVPELIKLKIKNSSLVFLSRYKRKYFLSADKNYRVTLDSKMQYYHLNHHGSNFLRKSEDRLKKILEVKYDNKKRNGAESITGFFPFRMGRNSKYVNGVERIHNVY